MFDYNSHCMKILVKIEDIIALLGSDVINVYGDIRDVYIDNLSDSDHVIESTLDWVKESNPRRQSIVENTPAKVVVVGESITYTDVMQDREKVLIVVGSPRNAIAKIGNAFFVQRPVFGIHPTAIVDDDAIIGEGVSIGPYCVIGKVKIGKGTTIGAYVKIYDSCEIGSNCNIADHVVLGGEGFGYEKDSNGNWMKFPQIGGLVIGDNVDIGSFTAIDRGALSVTKIGNYTKIDSMCKIAHNVVIGENVIITGFCGMGGSSTVGDNVWMGPHSSLKDWGQVGEGAFVGMGSVIVRKVKPNQNVFGNPAKELKY